jgi:predicted metalloprotease with PDZ domain
MRRVVWMCALTIAMANLGAETQRPATQGAVLTTPTRSPAAVAVTYRVSVPEPEHHWLQVETTVSGLGVAPLNAHMSRSSPGRYAVHEFAKNVFAIEAYDGRGRALRYTRPTPYEWNVEGHDGTVRLVYKLYGDLVDGTYLAVDTSHAHMNMPATFMWAAGFDDRPIRVTFVPPPGLSWRIATQLYPTGDPLTFTAPNLQYFMDSPTEFSNFVMSTFSVPNADGTPANFRVVAHADGAQADVDELARLIQRLVREEMSVYGEFPQYEPGYYTFLLDYQPYDTGDGMEHRNSTCITDQTGGRRGVSLKTPQGRDATLDTIAHEFFHNWNVERIRPAGLEPFDFTTANITCCLWLAEGFTQYYGPLELARAGFSDVPQAGANLARSAVNVINGAGRQVRSPVEMSQYAPFSDAARSIDPTDASRTFISYYTYGAAVALGLDLSLRELSGGTLSLDDYMRMLWRLHGQPGGPAPGLVGRPYSLTDLRDHLAELTGNRLFADTFFDKYVEGREVPDYAHLLSLAGYVMKPTRPDASWPGNVQVAANSGTLTVINLVAFGTPAYDAGLDQSDVITAIDGQPATMAVWNALRQKKVGDTVTLAVTHRGGVTRTRTMTLRADPSLTVEPVEAGGGTLSSAQRAFRDDWLGTKVK